MRKIKNAFLCIVLCISIVAFLAGCYMVGYRVNTLIGAALIAGAVSYVSAFYAANEEACHE